VLSAQRPASPILGFRLSDSHAQLLSCLGDRRLTLYVRQKQIFSKTIALTVFEKRIRCSLRGAVATLSSRFSFEQTEKISCDRKRPTGVERQREVASLQSHAATGQVDAVGSYPLKRDRRRVAGLGECGAVDDSWISFCRPDLALAVTYIATVVSCTGLEGMLSVRHFRHRCRIHAWCL